MDLSKLGRTEQVLAGAGLLLFIASFFPWFSYTLGLGDVGGYSGSENAWSDPSGFNDWFPILLLFVYAIVLALPAFGVAVNAPQLASPVNRAFIGLVLSALAVLLFAIQGLTYPSIPAGYGSAGPGWGYYVGLVLALAAGAQSYLGFTQQGGSLANVGAALKARTQTAQGSENQAPYGQGQQPYQPQQPYQQPTFGQAPQEPQQPYGQPGQQGEQQPPAAPPYGS